MENKTEFFECSCYSDEHTLKIVLDADRDYPELTTSVYLNNYHSFFKRFWMAFKYVFGYECKYGHWDCFILKPQDADRLLSIVTKYKEAWNKGKGRNA